MMALEWISWVLLLTGAVFSVIGGIGILRLPEFYSRMHGSGITDTLGAGLIVFGLIVHSFALDKGLELSAFKLVVILFFLTITSPSSCHALARSALLHGLHPELDSNRDAGKLIAGGNQAATPAGKTDSIDGDRR